MARIEYFDNLAALDSELLARVRYGRGGVSNLYRVLLHGERLATGWVGLSNAVRFESGFDGATRELAILMVARLSGCDYIWKGHVPHALREGVSEADLRLLDQWPSLSELSVGDYRLVALAGAIATHSPLEDVGLDRWISEADPTSVSEMAMLAGYFLGACHIARTLDVDSKGDEVVAN